MRVPPRLVSVLFSFSASPRQSRCHFAEVYDPFSGRRLPVHSRVRQNTSLSTNTTEDAHCQGPLFLPTEFVILCNNSVFILTKQKVYDNDSYVLVNGTLTLCLNDSRTNTETVLEKDIKNAHQNHSLVLRIITYVGFSLSIIALPFLLQTYFLFPELRTYPGKMVMHLSCAMIGMQAVYFASDQDVVSSTVCAVIGAFLHYFILASFLWMSAIAYNTQKSISNPSEICFLLNVLFTSQLVN